MMAYITKEEIESLNEILNRKNDSFPFENKEKFDLWFETWIAFPIKEILENNIQRNMRIMK